MPIYGERVKSYHAMAITKGDAGRAWSMKFELKDLSAEVACKFKQDFLSKRDIVEEYLAATKFTKAFTGAIQVKVWEYMPPISEALLPAWEGQRGYMKFAALRAKEGNAAIVHELIHVNAPNQSRFLAEGYAVYVEEKIGNIGAYPTFGNSIEDQMRKIGNSALQSVKLADFDRVPTKRGTNLGKSAGLETEIPDLAQRGEYTYLVSGSFVKFLVETHGLEKFKTLYELTPLTPGVATVADPDRYENVFGKPLTALQTQWLYWLEK
jgi:hypothetical protein